MKNIHIIPTDKPSRLHLGNSGLVLCDLNYNSSIINAQKIYITNDEEIKEGDWFYDTYCNVVSKLTVHGKDNRISEFKKIILTTDQDLIKDGVQSIDDDFLEWFVKNPSCEEVEVFQEKHHAGEVVDESYPKGFFDYKIVIPNDESKQETHICKYCKAETTQSDDECYAKPKQDPLEQAAKEYAEMHLDVSGNLGKYLVKAVFQDGGKWQQEQMYSEEEVSNLIEDWTKMASGLNMNLPRSKFNKWFKQFKK